MSMAQPTLPTTINLSRGSENFKSRPLQSAEDYLAAERLISECFGLSAEYPFYDDFPMWAHRSGAASFRLGVFLNEEIIGTASVRLAPLKTPNGKLLSCALIGAVATRSDVQGKGIASQLVSQLVTWSHLQGVALVLLWGSEHSLYRKMGFELCGKQGRIALSSLPLPKSFSGVHVGYTDQIFEMMRGRSSGVALSENDRPWIRAHQNVKWVWIQESGKFAYAGVGRGCDLHDLVHEWGGDPKLLMTVLSCITHQFPNGELLGSASDLKALQPSATPVTEYLALARVLDPMKVLATYDATGDLIISRQESGWRVQLPGQESKFLTEGALSQFLFNGETEKPALLKNLPLSLWIWGLDAS